jgi:hypothetical protein
MAGSHGRDIPGHGTLARVTINPWHDASQHSEEAADCSWQSSTLAGKPKGKDLNTGLNVVLNCLQRRNESLLGPAQASRTPRRSSAD